MVNRMVWKCPGCGSHEVHVISRHPTEPKHDRVECEGCGKQGGRYEFAIRQDGSRWGEDRWPLVKGGVSFFELHTAMHLEACYQQAREGICPDCGVKHPETLHEDRPDIPKARHIFFLVHSSLREGHFGWRAQIQLDEREMILAALIGLAARYEMEAEERKR